MKRLALTLVAALCMTATTYAVGNQPVKEGTAKQWEARIDVDKLGKFLQLNVDQKDEVGDICNYFNEQMIRANRSQKNYDKMLRNAIFSNLKLMKETLSTKQYADYTKVLQATLQNKGIIMK